VQAAEERRQLGRHLRADAGRQGDDDLLPVAFVQERKQLEPAFVLPQIDRDRDVGEHASEVGVSHVTVNHQRRDVARHKPIDKRLRDERLADAALIAVEEVNAQLKVHKVRMVAALRTS